MLNASAAVMTDASMTENRINRAGTLFVPGGSTQEVGRSVGGTEYCLPERLWHSYGW